MDTKSDDFLTKFADNAHLGKIATDLAPGIIMTATILLVLTSFTEMTVFPYAVRQRHFQQVAALQQVLDDLERQIGEREEEVEKCGLELRFITTSDTAKQAKQIEFETLSKRAERLRKRCDAKQTEFKELTAEAKDPLSLKANLQLLREHFVMLFIVGCFLGAALAQVSGKLFYNGRFYNYFKQHYPVPYNVLFSSVDHRTVTYYQGRVTDEAFLKRLPNLETEYYRYLEIAMNMILPFLALSVTLLVLGVKYRETAESGLALVLGVVGLFMTYALYRNARVLYVGYFLKKADVMELIKQNSPQPIPPRP